MVNALYLASLSHKINSTPLSMALTVNTWIIACAGILNVFDMYGIVEQRTMLLFILAPLTIFMLLVGFWVYFGKREGVD